MSAEEISRRAAEARDLFVHGYNCAQAVCAACADLYGLDRDTALRVSASFGGGIGQMRTTCGAACGMFLLAGLHNGNTLPDAPARKQINYRLVQSLADAFRTENGSLVCAELLGLDGAEPVAKKRPCAELVERSVRLFLAETCPDRPERLTQDNLA